MRFIIHRENMRVVHGPINAQQADGLPSYFSLEELAWFYADGRIDPTLTTITALEDADFERWVFMLRQARSWGHY